MKNNKENKKNCAEVEKSETDKKYADFISTVSHELRTPLTSIMGFADTLLTSGDKLSQAQQKKFLQIIKDQSKRLISMVENLLAVSKIQSSDEKFVFKSVNANDSISKITQLVKIQFKNRNIVMDLKQNLPEILIDTDKFQQIILNLIENAVKYSPENADIIIKTDYDDENVQISVIDNGIGIKDEDKTKIFEKFTRLDTPLTRKAEGSGLGLYIVKNLVEKMDAKINVENNNPTGSKFILTFKQAQYQTQSEKKLRG